MITDYLSHSPILLDKSNCIDLLEYGFLSFIVLNLIQTNHMNQRN